MVNTVVTGEDGTAVVENIPAVTISGTDTTVYAYTVREVDWEGNTGHMLDDPASGEMTAAFAALGENSGEQVKDCVFTHHYAGAIIKPTAYITVHVKDPEGNPVGGVDFYASPVGNGLPGVISVGNDGTGKTDPAVPAAQISTQRESDQRIFAPYTYDIKPFAGTQGLIFAENHKTVTFIICNTAENPLPEDVEVDFVCEKTNVAFKAVSEDGIGLEGITFRLASKDGSDILIAGQEPQASPMTLEASGKDGSLALPGLSKGTYILSAVNTPDGYLPAEAVTFTVEEETGEQGAEIVFRPIQMQVMGSVCDSNGHPIAGAVLELIDAETGKSIGKVTTEEAQNTSFPFLVPAGVFENGVFKSARSYRVREVAAAPGYVRSDKEMSVYYDYDSDVADNAWGRCETFINPMTRVRIAAAAAGSATGISLSGVELRLLDADGAVKAQWTSDGSAQVCEGLPAGIYTLEVASVPEGYSLPAPQEVIVSDDSESSPISIAVPEMLGRIVVRSIARGFAYAIRNAETGETVATLTEETTTSGLLPIWKYGADGTAKRIPYEYEQVTVPEGYLRDTQVHAISFTYPGAGIAVSELTITPTVKPAPDVAPAQEEEKDNTPETKETQPQTAAAAAAQQTAAAENKPAAKASGSRAYPESGVPILGVEGMAWFYGLLAMAGSAIALAGAYILKLFRRRRAD